LEVDAHEHDRVGRLDHRDRPWLTVPDVREASDFYLNAFGAVEDPDACSSARWAPEPPPWRRSTTSMGGARDV
jgi:hypothetical protein